MGRIYCDDNFGCRELETEEDVEWYHQVQSESVWKKCDRCGRRVKLRKSYGTCNNCMEMLERGLDP